MSPQVRRPYRRRRQWLLPILHRVLPPCSPFRPHPPSLFQHHPPSLFQHHPPSLFQHHRPCQFRNRLLCRLLHQLQNRLLYRLLHRRPLHEETSKTALWTLDRQPSDSLLSRWCLPSLGLQQLSTSLASRVAKLPSNLGTDTSSTRTARSAKIAAQPCFRTTTWKLWTGRPKLLISVLSPCGSKTTGLSACAKRICSVCRSFSSPKRVSALHDRVERHEAAPTASLSLSPPLQSRTRHTESCVFMGRCCHTDTCRHTLSRPSGSRAHRHRAKLPLTGGAVQPSPFPVTVTRGEIPDTFWPFPNCKHTDDTELRR